MNAGLPGTGIGGLFYIVGALWMPIHRTLSGGAREGRAWRRIVVQGGMAGAILLALFATGWLLGLALPGLVQTPAAGSGLALQQVRSVIRWVALVGTAGLLLAVLVAVEVASLLLRRRPLPPVTPASAALEAGCVEVGTGAAEAG